jgi:two-component system cell cycle response regulator
MVQSEESDPAPPRDALVTDDAQSASSTQTLFDRTQSIIREKKLPYLVILKGNESGRLYALTRSSMVVGRSQEADIPIDDERISRRHCLVVSENGRFAVEDCGSKNGTFVDGRPITRAVLSPDVTVQVGQTLFRVEYKDEGEAKRMEDLFRHATIDPLAEVHNRFYFMRRAREEVALARRQELPVAIVMLDMDSFKGINDTYGHLAGDLMVREVAQMVHKSKREEDLLARYGGDEFICMLRGAVTPEGVVCFCERVRQLVADSRIDYNGHPLCATLSVGAAIRRGKQLRLDDVIAAADRAMYRAKERGRNRTELDAEM